MGKLDDKIVLITGGTTGIGAETARLFAAQGATVIATGSNPASIDAARQASPGIEVVLCDQADTAASRALVADIEARHGRIDVLFVNAGIARFGPMAAVDEAGFDAQFDLNVRGAYFMVRAAAPAIPDGGAIVLTASTAASSGGMGMSVYAATKAAVRSFGRTFAAELAPRNVRVNIVSPGPIETPIFGKTGMDKAQIDGFLAGAKARIPLGRIGQPSEVAAAVLYLATDATFTTGEELIVGGGMINI